MKTFIRIITVLAVMTATAQAQQFQWAKNLKSSFTATGNMMYVDAEGNICITGYFQDSLDADPGPAVHKIVCNGFIDFFFAKYDKDGNFIFAKSIGGINEDYVYAMTEDKNMNIYLVGTIRSTVDFDPGPAIHELTNTPNANTIFFAKYDNLGNYIYASVLANNSNTNTISAIAADDNENLFIGGSFTAKMDFDPGSGTAEITPKGKTDGFIAKYNINGNFVWVKNMDGSGSIGKAFVNSICLDNSGNIYASGAFNTTIDFDPGAGNQNLTSNGSNDDIFFAKYDKDGIYVFAKSLGSVNADKGRSIGVDASGNIYISGNFNQTIDMDPGSAIRELTCNGDLDIFFAKYDNAGNYIYAKSIGSIQSDEPYSMRVKQSGDLYLTGYFRVNADFDPGANTSKLTSSGYGDIFLARYDKDGNLVFAGRMGGIKMDQGWDFGFYNNNIYLMGDFSDVADFDPGSGTFELTADKVSDIFIAKYADIYTASETAVNINEMNIYSSGNRLFISGNSPDAGSLRIFSMHGQEIIKPLQIPGTSFNISLNLPAGMYIIKLSCSNKEYTKKSIILH